jgi:adenylate kinase
MKERTMGKRLILLGAPGSGKGTWSKILSDEKGLPHIATGDLFRAELAAKTPLGRKVKSFMDQGALVPDELTLLLVEKALSDERAVNGFILDGFPRTIPQAEALTEFLEKRGQAIDMVINIVVDESVLIERTLSRLVCIKCGQPYNDVFGISGRPPHGQQTDGGTGAETSDVSNAGCDARELASRGHYFPLQPLTICGITVFRD